MDTRPSDPAGDLPTWNSDLLSQAEQLADGVYRVPLGAGNSGPGGPVAAEDTEPSAAA